jgi:hypothetical protein
MKNPPWLLAFVHIEKAAGTTLIHLLRHNYFLRYLDVRPYSANSAKLYTANDLMISRRMLPGLRCIAGHAVRPIADLESSGINIKYITLLRRPVDRYLSQYKYWTDKMGKRLTFEQFLDHRPAWNFQTSKISGHEDIELAKELLTEKFFLVGTVERFGQFLFLLKNKLEPAPFDVRHSRKNFTKRDGQAQELYMKFADEIEARNKLDWELYNYVETSLLPKFEGEYGENYQLDYKKFESELASAREPLILRGIDYFFRKCYVEPVGGVIRIFNGLPAAGSY